MAKRKDHCKVLRVYKDRHAAARRVFGLRHSKRNPRKVKLTGKRGAYKVMDCGPKLYKTSAKTRARARAARSFKSALSNY